MLTRLSAAVLAAVLICSSAHAEQAVRLLANTSPPYADAKLPQQGLALELVTHIYSRTDYAPEITIETWSRALEGVRLGVYDALAAAWYTPERSEEFLFSEPYLESELILVKLRTHPGDYFELQHLEGKRLGVRADYAYGIDFDSVTNLTLVEENHLIQNLLNLLNGSVDFVIGDQRTMAKQLKDYLGRQALKFEVVDIKLPGRARHIAAGRGIEGHEDMIEAFNKALKETRTDGSYDAILKKWDAEYGSIR